jgi:hypothetical protein
VKVRVRNHDGRREGWCVGGCLGLMNEGHCGGSAFAVFGGRGRTVGVLICILRSHDARSRRMVCGGDLDLMNERHCAGSAFAFFWRARTVGVLIGCPDSRADRESSGYPGSPILILVDASQLISE